MNTLEESFERWIKLLRYKASDYEHLARKNGERTTQPDLDSICNEMEAFLNGFLSDKKPKEKIEYDPTTEKLILEDMVLKDIQNKIK